MVSCNMGSVEILNQTKHTILTFSDCDDSIQDPLTSTEYIIKTVEGFSFSKVNLHFTMMKMVTKTA